MSTNCDGNGKLFSSEGARGIWRVSEGAEGYVSSRLEVAMRETVKVTWLTMGPVWTGDRSVYDNSQNISTYHIQAGHGPRARQ